MSDAPHPWSADREGRHPDDDKLGRLEFAKRVAKELCGWRNKESLVVSLNGDWGSGKTTLINLILYYIEEQSKATGKKAPLVVRFNPWQWSGQDLITQAFFSEIGKKFRTSPAIERERAKRLLKVWEKFRDVSLAGGEIAQRLRDSMVALIALLAGGSGVLAGQLKSGLFASILEWASVGLLTVAGLCGIYAPVAEAFAKLVRKSAEKAPPSLESVRDELKAELAQLESSVIVVVDDMDRLTQEQVRMMVQLVKANADFDNVVYLLPFQRNIVAAALDHVTCEKGHDFLKKIVQVDLEVPDAPPEKLRVIFFERMDKIWRRAEFRWDAPRKDRWRNMFEDAIWPFFDTPRSVIRFCSVMDFVFDGHIDDGALRIDPIDLVTLETLRMFEPEAYELIKRSRNSSRNVFLELLHDDKERQQKIEADFKGLIDREGRTEADKKRLRAALYGLIPQAAENGSSDSAKANWDRDCRVCHPKHFPKYFQLQPSPDDVPAGLIAKFLRESTPEARLGDLWQEAVKTNKIGGLIERLWLVRDEIPVERVEPLILAILATTDSLPEIKIDGGFFQNDAQHEIIKLCARLLTRISEPDKRDEVFKNVVRQCEALSGPVMLTGLLEPNPEHHRHEDPIITPEAVEDAKQVLIPRMWAKAKTPEFWALRMAGYIFYRLKEWAGADAVRAWLDLVTKDNAIARKCLSHFLSETQSTGKIARTIVLPAKSVEDFISLETLYERMAGPSLTSLEQCAMERIQLALRLKAEGKPYDRIPVMGFDSDGKEITDLTELRHHV
jgi:hypothetical protein